MTSFTRDGDTGLLSLRYAAISDHLDGARAVSVSGSERTIYVASEFSNDVSVFEDRGACLSCAAGTYQDESGMSVCNECLAGEYQNLAGQVLCLKCPAGTAQGETRRTSVSDCLSCPTGTYGDEDGLAECRTCPAGTYQPLTRTIAELACLTCPVGEISATRGSESCETCSLGLVPNGDRTECIVPEEGGLPTELIVAIAVGLLSCAMAAAVLFWAKQHEDHVLKVLSRVASSALMPIIFMNFEIADVLSDLFTLLLCWGDDTGAISFEIKLAYSCCYAFAVVPSLVNLRFRFAFIHRY